MLQLYGHPFSSYTWKAQIALIANGTEHRFRMIDPGHPDNLAFIGQAHPAGKFPVLEDGDTVVIEATSIIEHVALHHPGDAPLIPADPEKAALARMLDRVFDNYVMGNMQRVVVSAINHPQTGETDEAVSAKAALRRTYDWLENWLADNRLPADVSLVTCAAAPSLFYADWIDPIGEDRPRLQALRGELLALDAVRQCVDAARPYRHLFPLEAPDRD